MPEIKKLFPLKDGDELFRVPAGTDVWFEDLPPPEYGFRVHCNPKPEDIKPNWSREWPPLRKSTPNT